MADVLFGRPPLMVDTVAAVTLFKKMDWSGLEPGPRPFRAGGVVSSSSSILVVFRFFCLLVCFCFFNHSSRKKPIEGRSVRISFPSIFLRSTHRTIQTKLDGLVQGGGVVNQPQPIRRSKKWARFGRPSGGLVRGAIVRKEKDVLLRQIIVTIIIIIINRIRRIESSNIDDWIRMYFRWESGWKWKRNTGSSSLFFVFFLS